MRRSQIEQVLLIVLLTTLTGCGTGPAVGSPTLAPTETEPPPRVARVSALPPSATPTPVPATPTPIPPTLEPTASATPGCIASATFIADVTVPDGSVVAPNSQLVKTWRVKNSGTCDWGAGFTLVLVGKNLLGGPAVVSMPPTRAGSTRDVSVALKAPANPGAYDVKWQLRAPDGAPLTAITVSIVVPATPTPTSPPTATPKPTVIPTYAATLESFVGDWRIVKGLSGYESDDQRLFKIVIGSSGNNLLVSPAAWPTSPYKFAFTGQVTMPYTGGPEIRIEFDDAARGHVTIRMGINKACNATVNLSYGGYRGRFIVQNERAIIPCQ